MKLACLARPARWLVAWAGRNPLLAAVLAVGFGLRVANILWGIPLSEYSSFYHGDEEKAWGSTILFPEGYLASTSYLYGTSIQYLVGTLLLPAKLVMTGWLGLDRQYILVAVVFSRFCNVLMGTAALALVFLLARKLFDETVGLVSAALLCVAPSHCLSSCYATLDVPMSFLLLLGFLLLFHAAENPRTRSFVLLGLVAGVLLGTKITGGMFLLLSGAWLAAGMVGPSAQKQGIDRSGQLTNLLTYFLVAIAVFAILSPQVVLSFSEYLDFMMQQKARWYDKAPPGLPEVLRTWYHATALAVGTPVAGLAPVGLLWVLGRPRRAQKLAIGLFLVAYYGFWKGYLPPRFVIFVAPILCMLAAAVCGRLLTSRLGGIRVAAFACVLAFVGASLWTCATGVVQRFTDARTQAARFIAQRIPPGATIGIATDHNDHWFHHGWRYPRIDFERFRQVHFLEGPQYVVVTSFELDTMRSALHSTKLLPGYRWDPRFKRQWYLSDPPRPRVFKFYDDLLAGKGYRLLASFQPLVRSRTEILTPDVYIYERRGSERVRYR